MEWHAGNTLSQTVFTLLYVHHLADLHPDFIPLGSLNRDPARPPELVTVVLRAAVFGLLKSCDLAWRELSQNKVHDVRSSYYYIIKPGVLFLHKSRERIGKARNAKFLFWRVSQSNTFFRP